MMMNLGPITESKLRRASTIALILGITCLGISAVDALGHYRRFFVGYLIGYTYWAGLSLGCLGLALLHHLTGGRWGFVIRRFLEAGFMTLPIMALLFVPILLGMRELYPWHRAEGEGIAEFEASKAAYLNPIGFAARAFAMFVVWVGIAWLLRRWSILQDQRADAAPTRWIRTLCGPALVLHSFGGTIVVVDWVMSLEPQWYSTIFALMVLIGQILNAIALMILLLAAFSATEPIATAAGSTHYHHLGNLLLAFVLFWTYLGFSQFLIIYSGNLPNPISWYLHRTDELWKWILIVVVLFHCFFPFVFLLSRSLKRQAGSLAFVACLILAAHMMHWLWVTLPSFQAGGCAVHWSSGLPPIGIGGVWVASFLFILMRRPLLPVRDPGHLLSASHEY